MKYHHISISDLARQYYELGINLVAIVPGQKKPLGRWQHLQKSRQSFQEFESISFTGVKALGAITGHNRIWAIDIDPHPGEVVPNGLALEALNLLGLPANYPWLIRTGKGYHIWIQSDPHPLNTDNNILSTKAKEGREFNHLELRITGNTLLPGSVHPSGRVYHPVTGNLPIMEPPQEVSRESVEKLVMAFCQMPSEVSQQAVNKVKSLSSTTASISSIPPGKALKSAVHKIRNATDGHKWNTIRQQAYYIGGYIGSGRLAYEECHSEMLEAIISLPNVKDINHAINTLVEGFRDGQSKPISPSQEFQLEGTTITTKTGQRMDEAGRYIESRWDIRYNLIRNRKEVFDESGKREFRDSDFADIYRELHRVGINIKKTDLETLLQSRFIPQYNPLIDWFENRDGWIPEKGQIKALAASLNQSTYSPEQWENLLRKWLVGTVAGIRPGRFNILQLVLYGKQNIGKTEFFERLIPEELKEYCTANQLDDKEAERLMCEFWIIVDDEYSGKTKGDSKRLKYLLSQRYFTYRIPYSKNPVKADRIASLCGSTNEPEILADTTGNRRVIPVNVETRDFEAFDAINKEAVWMEAYNLLKSGFDYELTKEEIRILNESTGEFERYSSEYELICKYVEEAKPGIGYYVTATEIVGHILNYSHLKVNKIIVGKELKRMGFHQETKKRDGKTQRLYHLVLRDNEGRIVPPNTQ